MITKTPCHFCSSHCGMLVNIENNRPVKLLEAPCEQNCPAGIDIPRYIRLIADGQFDEAISVIREKVPFPGVLGCICTHPCEAECCRGESDEAISIRALKAFVASQDTGVWKAKVKVAKPSGKKVAVIGSGPAGLTAGYYLTTLGHSVTVFEALPAAGGMLRVGIPEYRLSREVLDREIEEIKSAGVEIKTNSRVESLDRLFEQGYSAVFVAVGAHQGTKLPIPGTELNGVLVGLSFLKDLNTGTKPKIGKRVAVIGGGNVALDAARSALRLGADEVNIYYRRSREEMPVTDVEYEQAVAEGVQINFLYNPTRIVSENGEVSGLQCARMELGKPDESGRRRPIPIAGSEHFIKADTVIAAVGEVPALSFLGEQSQALTGGGETIKVKDDTLATAIEGIFAGGDVVTGPASVILAIADGRKAAIAIDKYLGGEGNLNEVMEPQEVELSPSGIGEVEGFKNRLPVNMMPVARRTESFAQVELGFDEEKAIEEAKRCLWCDMADGDPENVISYGWVCKRGRAHTARRFIS